MSRGQKNHKFMERLKQRRAELNLKQDELEELYNFGKGTISQYERGVRYPSDMASLAKALGVYEKWLSGESDIKDIEQIHSMFSDLLSNTFKDSIEVFRGFSYFARTLGYNIELSSDNSHFLITTSEGNKHIAPETMNEIYRDIVNGALKRFDLIENEAINNAASDPVAYISIIPQNTEYSDIEYSEEIQQILDNKKKRDRTE